ncbi:MAG: ABC transporter permease [Nanoarchaeota archaeon]|nr:ABC transporter permease [Nanoarchaeota archaeon]
MKEKPQRVFLTTFGIFIGIFTFVFFQFAGNGLSAGVEDQLSTFGLNVITLSPADAPPQTGPPSGGGITQNQLREVERVARGYNYVTGGIFYPAIFSYGREEAVIVTQAFPDENLYDIEQDLNFNVAQGRNLRPGDRGVVVLGAKVAKETFSRELQLGNSISFDNGEVDRTFRVVGILEQRDDLFVDFSMRLSLSDIQDI